MKWQLERKKLQSLVEDEDAFASSPSASEPSNRESTKTSPNWRKSRYGNGCGDGAKDRSKEMTAIREGDVADGDVNPKQGNCDPKLTSQCGLNLKKRPTARRYCLE
jgi:hypothetical protein